MTTREGIELIKAIQVLVAPKRIAKAPANAPAIPGKVLRNASKYRSRKLRAWTLGFWFGMALNKTQINQSWNGKINNASILPLIGV